MSTIDFHCHSSASDGTLSPMELALLAKEKNLTRLALTDHDTTANVEALRECLVDSAIELVNGVEISAVAGNRTVHIVGLGIELDNNALQSRLAEQRALRHQRASQIADKLDKFDLDGVDELRSSLAQQHVVCRTHVADWLVAQGHAKNFQQVFKRWLGKNAKAAVSDSWMTMAEAVQLIDGASGVAVLAHPGRYSLSTSQLNGLVAEFVELGGKGLEVSYPNIDRKLTNRLANLCNKHNIWASLGSDFHSPDKPWAMLGKIPPVPEVCRVIGTII